MFRFAPLCLVFAVESAFAADVCWVDYTGFECNKRYALTVPDIDDDWSVYGACSSTSYNGPELINEFAPPAGTNVTLYVVGPTNYDVDVLVLKDDCTGGCAGKSQLAGSNGEEVQFTADGGSYLIAIDGKNASTSPFSAEMVVGCDTTCAASDVVEPLTCGSEIVGNTAGGTTALDYFTCGSPYHHLPQPGAEDIYTFRAQRSGDVTVHIDGMTGADQDIYVLEASCDPDECITGSTASGRSDELTFYATVNTDYYVVIEAYGGLGPYELSFDTGSGACLEDCDDQRDDDGDGAYDCADSDCATDPACDCALVTLARDTDADGFGQTSGNRFGLCQGDPRPAGWVDNTTDCDDTSKNVNPGATEACNNRDDNCNSIVDEGVKTTYYLDNDGDSFGDSGETTEACTPAAHYVTNADDCNDQTADQNPNAVEICDGIDQNCDDVIDNDAPDPGTGEVCNGVDDDCDGQIDEGTECVDDDGDCACEGEAADCTVSINTECTELSGGDCDDEDPLQGPLNEEIADGADQDCDGIIDEGTEAYDDDGDGYTELFGDCNDNDARVNAGVEEIPSNATDDDCDGLVDEGSESFDDDGDGVTEAGGDCDDGDPAISPNEPEETGNGIDDDCDPSTADNSETIKACGCNGALGLGAAWWTFTLVAWITRRRS